MLEAFLQYIQHEKRYSEHTLTAYKSDIANYIQFLETEFSIQHVQETNASHIRSWMVSLTQNRLSTRSIGRKLASIKAFYKFLFRTGKIQNNPAQRIQLPATAKTLPGFVPEAGMQKLESEFESQKGFEAIRNSLIIEMFYQTGIRLSELVNLKFHDVDTINHNIKVMGKRKKERVIPITESLAAMINEYEVVIKEHFEGTESRGTFFLTDKGNKIYPKLVYRVVNLYLSMVTSMDKKSPHVLRHTFATHMLNSGADLNAIKELLGHSSLAATQVYTHVSIEKLKKIYKQAHPKA